MRQYIGARYVPKFFENSSTHDSTWATGVSYEPLTIVSWNSNLYTSKKPVPANVGSPNNNRDYWELTGTNSVGTLTARVDQLEEDTEKNFPARRFVIFGDSYNSVTNEKWSDIVIDKLGLVDSVLLSEGGYAFVSHDGKTWLNKLRDASLDNNSITDLLIVGGANDAFVTLSLIEPAIIEFDTYCRGRFPNLENIYLGFVGNGFADNNQHNMMQQTMRTYVASAKKLGWSYLNNIETTLYDPTLMQKIGTNDFIHPNVEGATLIGYNAVQCLRSGCCKNYRAPRAANVTISNNFSSPTNTAISETIIDNNIGIKTNNINLVVGSENIGPGFIELGTFAELTNGITPYTFLSMILIGPTPELTFPVIMTFPDYNTVQLYLPKALPSGTHCILQGMSTTIVLP